MFHAKKVDLKAAQETGRLLNGMTQGPKRKLRNCKLICMILCYNFDACHKRAYQPTKRHALKIMCAQYTHALNNQTL